MRNTLITNNHDRKEGYTPASEETEVHDVYNLFTQFDSNNRQCKQELVKEVCGLGDNAAEGAIPSECGWMLRQRSQATT